MNTRISRLLLLVVAACAIVTGVVACSGDAGGDDAASTGQVALDYATKFSIENLDDGSRIVTDSQGVRFLLVPEGRERPAGYDDLTLITTPVKRVVCMSTTQICNLRPIEALGVVCGVASDRDSFYLDEIKQGMDDGLITQVAGDMDEPDYEKVVALKPDVVFTYTESGAAAEKMYAKFKELGIPTVVDNSWLERDPLARMEYVKLMAAFVGKDSEAATFFDEAVARVKQTEETVATATAKPAVVWAMTSDGTTFYVESRDTYCAKEVEMAGGDFVFSDIEGGGSVQMTTEEVYTRALDADVWIFSSMSNYFQGLKELKKSAPLLEKTKPFKAGEIWLYQPWYWQTVDRTDEVIADLAAILHPDLFPDHEVKHFVRAE